MKNYMKTILNGIQSWTKKEVKNSTADWNQNDTTANNFVKNRTHWEEEPMETVIVPEQTIEGFAIMEEPFYGIQIPYSIQLKPNKTYTIIWDGIKYDLQYNELENGFGFIGNENYFNMQSGGNIPFIIVLDVGMVFFVTESTAESHTISVTTIESIIHHLDPKYIKDMYYEYMAPNIDVVIPEQTVSSDNNYSFVETGIDSLLVDGASYIVTWNDQTYTCIARQDSWGDIYIGNQAIGVEVDDWQFPEAIESNEPFFLYTYNSDDWGLCVQTAGEYTVSVIGTGEKLTPYKIDEKYIPDSVVENIDELWMEVNNVRTVANSAQTTANNKMDKSNPVGTGSFSMNRRSGTVVGNYSHAEGDETTASGNYSHTEGHFTTASGSCSHAEGSSSTASNGYSHAEGNGTIASGSCSHAEGGTTTASGPWSHAEGNGTTASGDYSHAEGNRGTAYGSASHVEGSQYSYNLKATGEANSTTYKINSTSNVDFTGKIIIYNTIMTKILTYNLNTKTITVEKTLSTTQLTNAPVRICLGGAFGNWSHAEGLQSFALGHKSHAEGSNTVANGEFSHAEGNSTIANGSCSHTEGKFNSTDYYFNFSEPGNSNIDTSLTAQIQYAKDYIFNPQDGSFSLINPVTTTLNLIPTPCYVKNSHGSFYKVLDDGKDSNEFSFTSMYPIIKSYAHIVGNGASDTERSNAHTLDWEGNAWYAGDVYVGSTSGTNKDNGSKKLITLDEVKPIILPLFDTFYRLAHNDEIPYIEGYDFYTYYNALTQYPQVYIVSGFEELDIDTGGLIGGNDPWVIESLSESNITLSKVRNKHKIEIYLQPNFDTLQIFIYDPEWLNDIPEIKSQVFVVTQASANEYEDLAEAIYNASQAGQIVIFQRGDNIYYLEYAELEPAHYASFYRVSVDGAIHSIIINGSTITDSTYNPNNYIDTAIANLVDSAPETLNTLNELAAAIQENDNVINTLNAAITDKADKTALEELQTQVTATSLILADAITGEKYTIQIQNGQLVSFPVEE